jgi:hypothetical protein
MAREHNFLLGQGERLATKVSVGRKVSDKNPPYDFATARKRIGGRLADVAAKIADLPEDACPRGEAVAVVTLHPRYLAKSDFPTRLFTQIGVRAVGSRSRDIVPERWGIKKPPEHAVTEDIFVAGARTAFERWASEIRRWRPSQGAAEDLTHIEDLTVVDPAQKLKAIAFASLDDEDLLLEIVLHNSNSDDVVLSFIRYAKDHGCEALADRRHDVRGLTFMPVRAPPEQLDALARFAFLRIARGMPTLRPMTPAIGRSAAGVGFAVNVPAVDVLDDELRAVIFDGGIPMAARSALKPWVNCIDPPGIGKALPDLEEHGLAVTSAFLFGPLKHGEAPKQPLCAVDHVRVIDENTGAGGTDLLYYDALDRITAHLDRHPGRYALGNISVGPKLPVDDTDVTLWTAELDRRFAHGRFVATVATGNDGHLDPKAGLNRVQPPSDGVNVLSVGAAYSTSPTWQRADYSCLGPGRSPGLVKPDGVAFGGCANEPFGVLSTQTGALRGCNDAGTSYASPFALRSAASALVQVGNGLRPLAVRALLIHRAESDPNQARRDIGWGRFESDALRLITSDDNEALIVFQGELPVGEHLRAPVPMPDKPLTGDVQISATLVISPEVDPEHPGAYTRSGLVVTFRPHDEKFPKPKDGSVPKHAKPRPFFSPSLLYSESEAALREDGLKWEPCLRNEVTFRASSLKKPTFDIYYHHRESAVSASDPQPIPYAFIVGLRAAKVPDLYNQVLRAHARILQPLQPRVRLQIGT